MANPLLSYRAKKRLSQAELGALLGVSRQTVGSWEDGTRTITAEWAIKVERKIGIDRLLLRPDIFRKRAA